MIKQKLTLLTNSGTSLYDLANTLIDESQHGIIVLDCEQNILVWNKQISEWSGLSRTQAIGLTIEEVFPTIHQSKLQSSIEQCIKNNDKKSSRFHGQQPVLPLSNASGELPHEVHITAVPDLHGSNFCVLEILDTSRLHNLHNSLHTQSKEFDDLIRSSITNDAQLHALFNNPLFSVLLVDQEGLVLKHNRRAEELFSLNNEDWLEIFLSDLFFDENQKALSNKPMEIFTSNQTHYFVHNPNSRNQQNAELPVHSLSDATPVRLCSTRITLNKSFGFMILIEDHQQQAVKSRKVERAQKDIELAFNLVSDAIIKTDAHCVIRSFNSKAEQLTACSASEAIGTSLHDIISLNDSKTEAPFYISEQWINAHEKEKVIKNLKVTLSRRDHQKVAIDLSVTTVSYLQQAHSASSDERELILVLKDNSAIQEYDRKLAWHNTHDSLTGLVNRNEFEKRLEHLIRDVQNHQQHHAVLHLGLDQLKIINNTCGHDAGDALLQEVTAFIKGALGTEDTVARLGGDEFGILLHNKKTSNAHKFAQKLNDDLYQYRFKWQDQEFPASTSIGLVSINITSLDVKNALSNAQAACLLAKESGRNRVQLYATGHNNLIKQQHRLHWHSRIQKALDNDSLVLHAQLIVPASHQQHLQSRLELLVRIIDDGKLVMPDTFIPAAEHYQLMPKIDQWVVANCLAFYAQLPKNLRIPLNINLSGQSIGDESFLQFLIHKITHYDIDPSLLCFELTETAAIFDLDAAKEFMNELAKMGCEFALDDFGSGLSSLSYLKNLPVDYLKIDGAFVKSIIGNHVDDEILQSINRIGHVMNIKTVAEYVENSEIRTRLEEIGVDYLQGFLIHKPVPLRDYFESHLEKAFKSH